MVDVLLLQHFSVELTHFRKEAPSHFLKVAMFSCVMADIIYLIMVVLSLYVLAL